MKFEKPFLLSLVAPLMILVSTIGLITSKNSKKIFYLPIGLMGFVLVAEKDLGRRFKRMSILNKIKSFQETK
tara:strand:- start:418 stop:633 length:216 start_codon:yes stop_codon:yes gene_type:complete